MIIDAVVSCVFTIAIGMALIVTLREVYVKGVDLSTMTTEKKKEKLTEMFRMGLNMRLKNKDKVKDEFKKEMVDTNDAEKYQSVNLDSWNKSVEENEREQRNQEKR